MKNTLQTVLTISNTDILTMLVKRRVNLKVPILRQQKINLLSKYVAILKQTYKKRWDENNSKDNTKRCKTVVSLYNPIIEFTTCR
jgi:hypothetical protein